MATCLGIELGTQTHNSQSLHIYEWNDIAQTMIEETKSMSPVELYNSGARERRMDFAFVHEYPANRYREVEYYMSLILENVKLLIRGEEELTTELEKLKDFSAYFYNVYRLLKIYTQYKLKLSGCKSTEEKDLIRHTAISDIEVLESEYASTWDLAILAKNFFVSRLSMKNGNEEILGNL